MTPNPGTDVSKLAFRLGARPRRWMAQRSKATAREISASHVPFLSHPDEVAHIILQAANTVVPV